jgi:hypothetical protein
MLLRSSGVVEKSPPRLWSLGVAACLLSLAALVAGVGLRADAVRADEPAPKEDVKKEEPKKEDPAKKGEGTKEDVKKEEPKKDKGDDLPEIDDLIKNLPPGLNAEQMKQLREQMKRMAEQMRRQFPDGQGAGGGFRFGAGFAGPGGGFNAFTDQSHEGRLGVRVKEPSATLVDQLDLPKGQGVVVEDVTPDSPAAKAGLKANDILLEVGGKPVASNVADVVKMIHGLKANTPVDAVVMRKGKKETVKGLSLPEAKAVAPGLPANPFQFPVIPFGNPPPGGHASRRQVFGAKRG